MCFNTSSPLRFQRTLFTGALLLGALAVASQAKAANLTVSNLRDAGRGSLRAAITRANSTVGSDMIRFDPGLGGTLGLKSTLPTLCGGISIIGPGRDRVNVRRVSKANFRLLLVASNGVVSLSGLTLSNGRNATKEVHREEDSCGGALLNFGNVQISDCILTGNNTSGGGGGAIATYGSLTLWNCSLTHNKCIFTDMLGPFGGGGALFADTGGEAFVNNCTFSANISVDANGGAIASYRASIKIRDSIFNGNHAYNDSEGGALSAGGEDAGEFDVSNSTFSNNTASRGGATSTSTYYGRGGITLENCTFSGNQALQSGGAIEAWGELSMRSCTVVRNRAPRGAGLSVREPIWVDSRTGPSDHINVGSNIIAGNLMGTDVDVVPRTIRKKTDKVSGKTASTKELSPTISDGFNFIGTGTAKSLSFFHAQGDRSRISVAALKLGPLALNGGLTPTHSLLSGSSAINKGAAQSETDQRGALRSGYGPQDSDLSDVGAFEFTWGRPMKFKK